MQFSTADEASVFKQFILLRVCLHGVGDPGVEGLISFVSTLWGDTKQKKPTPLDLGPPLHVNRV